MGILGLSRLIADVAPEAIKEIDLKSLFGRRVAIDASMSIYQFLIAIRSNEYQMTNEAGESTSHLVGLFYRTIKLVKSGIKPVYVFDGKAPILKSGELSKRAERRIEAKEKLEEAKEVQNVDDIQRFNKRLVKVTRKHNEDCKKLLSMLGIPVIQAPSEAEAQCAQLCKENLVYAVATEDMDALTFGCPILLRNLTLANNEKIKEFHVEKILNCLNLTQNQFIDLSILMGCDYCDNIKGIGGKKGLELIRKFKNIEGILNNKFGINEFATAEIEYNARKFDQSENLNSESELENNERNIEINNSEENEQAEESKEIFKSNKKQVVPSNWPFRGARQLFLEPLVLKNQLTDNDLKIKDIDEEGIVQFLCQENGFSEDRVRKSLKRIADAKNKGSQTRIDSFFKIIPSNSPVKRTVPSSKDSNSKKGNKKGRKLLK